MSKDDTVSINQFPGYTLEFDNLINTDRKSRTGVFIKENIIYTRRNDLEEIGLSTVWLQVKTQERKQILIQSLYRQFKRLDTPNTSSITSQQERWDQLTSKWAKALEEQREVIAIGEYNINSIEWNKDYKDKSTYDRRTWSPRFMPTGKIMSR